MSVTATATTAPTCAQLKEALYAAQFYKDQGNTRPIALEKVTKKHPGDTAFEAAALRVIEHVYDGKFLVFPGEAETTLENDRAAWDVEEERVGYREATEPPAKPPAPAQTQFTDPLPLVPAELKAKQNWVRWKLELVDGRWTKIPYQLNGKKASSTDPSTWNTYEAIVTGAVLSENEGVGIMTDGSFVGFDLDGCRNPQTGEITGWAQRVIDTLGAYTEITPSGYGVRVYALGQLPDGARRFSLALSSGFGSKVGIETYDQTRYFTITGNRVGDCSSLQSSNVAQAHALCADISREFPSEKRNQAAQFHGNDSGNSSVVFTRKPGSLASKLSVLMYGKIISQKPFVIENEHGDQVSAASQSEADMSLATLLAIEHGDNPELIDQDFRESSLYRQKWERDDYRDNTIAKAIETAKKSAETTPVETYATSEQPNAQSTAQTQAKAAEEASQGTQGTFPEGEAVSEGIPEFDESVITGTFRKLVDAICKGTTIPRQYALHAVKALACSILTKYKIELEDCESARTYFIVFGPTGTGKGLSFRRLKEIVDKAQNIEDFVRITTSFDSGAGIRDAFLEMKTGKNRPILYFADEIKTLGQKADGKKNPEIVSGIIELANSTTVSRAKSKKSVKGEALAVREDCWLLTFMCAQDGEAYATAFPRTKAQGLPDRFVPEYSPKIIPGRLPKPDITLGLEGIADLLKMAQKLAAFGGVKESPEVKDEVDQVWNSQPQEFQESPRLRQQFMLEMYLAAYSRGSAVAEAEDLAVAVKMLDRQKAIRLEFFTEEIPNQVGVYTKRLKDVQRDMLYRLRRGVAVGDVAMSLPQLMTHTLAYKENDLENFNRAWKSLTPLWLEVKVTGVNGHTYKKFIPTPGETDMWLPGEQGRVLA